MSRCMAAWARSDVPGSQNEVMVKSTASYADADADA